jgi:protein-S-isoprenylcysteine O-methyltransferase Ste14
MMIAIGNFFFRFRDGLFPVACLFVFLPGARIFPSAVTAALVGLAVAAAGQTVRIATIGLRYIVRGGRNRRVYADDLVTDGVYQHSRNPMYVGNMLILSGLALASNSSTCVLIAVPFFVFVYCAIIAAEENFLLGKFGDSYRAYMRDVPRWLPRMSGWRVTFSASRFHWRRVAVKEYGTPFGWTVGIGIIFLCNLYRDGQLQLQTATVTVTFALMFASFVVWTGLRTLKKRKLLVAD